jgi:hypothetical protein
MLLFIGFYGQKPSKESVKMQLHCLHTTRSQPHHVAAAAAMTVGGWRAAIALCANRRFIDAPGQAMIIPSSCLAAFPSLPTCLAGLSPPPLSPRPMVIQNEECHLKTCVKLRFPDKLILKSS